MKIQNCTKISTVLCLLTINDDVHEVSQIFKFCLTPKGQLVVKICDGTTADDGSPTRSNQFQNFNVVILCLFVRTVCCIYRCELLKA